MTCAYDLGYAGKCGNESDMGRCLLHRGVYCAGCGGWAVRRVQACGQSKWTRSAWEGVAMKYSHGYDTYNLRWQVALRAASPVCTDEDCDLSGAMAHAGPARAVYVRALRAICVL